MKLKFVNEVAENEATGKRYRKELDTTKDYAITKFAKEMIDVSDNLERAGEYIAKIKVDEEDDVEQLKKHIREVSLGMDMTSTVMHKTLNKFDVTKFDTNSGDRYNPKLHEQVATVDTSHHEDNMIHNVSEPGWKIGDQVLRKSKVHVVKKK